MRCELIVQSLSAASGPAGSCGLDFWWSETSRPWIAKYLNAEAAELVLEEGAQRASLKLFLRRLPLGVYLASTYPYGWVEGEAELFSNAAAKVITRTLRHNRVIRVEAAFTGECVDSLPTGDTDERTACRLDVPLVRHVLDLSGFDRPAETDRIFNRKLRWAVNRARRDGGQVRCADVSEVGVIQDIYAETMRAKGAPVNYGVDRFLGILQLFVPQRTGNILVGYLHGKPMGMAAFVDGEQSRHLLQLAVLPEAQSSRLGDLLISECIRDAVNCGKAYFDFMASSSHDHGLMEFKEKWGSLPQRIQSHVLPGIPGLGLALDLARAANRRWGWYRAS